MSRFTFLSFFNVVVDQRLEQAVLAEQCRRICSNNVELGRQAASLNNRLSVWIFPVYFSHVISSCFFCIFVFLLCLVKTCFPASVKRHSRNYPRDVAFVPVEVLRCCYAFHSFIRSFTDSFTDWL